MIFISQTNMFGQKLKVHFHGHRDGGVLCFAFSSRDSLGNVIAQTDADYSFFDVFDTDCGQNAITLITTATLLQDGDYKYSYRWLCLDSHLQIKFFYPQRTIYAYPWKDGITLFKTSRIDGHTGAVNSKGELLLGPKYIYFTMLNQYVNGITKFMRTDSSYVFHCDVVDRYSFKKECEFNVIFDTEVPMHLWTPHGEYRFFIEEEYFNDLMTEFGSDYDSDTLEYLWGLYEMFNMNFEEALSHFEKIESKASFHGLFENIIQCKCLLARLVSEVDRFSPIPDVKKGR